MTLAVWRRELDVNYRVLDGLEKIALAGAMAGATFGDICASLAFANPQRDEGELAQVAGGLLVRWFSDGMIVDATPVFE